MTILDLLAVFVLGLFVPKKARILVIAVLLVLVVLIVRHHA